MNVIKKVNVLSHFSGGEKGSATQMINCLVLIYLTGALNIFH